jgi:hypothetical protein
VIEFPPSYPERKLLKRAVRWSLRNRYRIPSLTKLEPKRSLQALTKVGRDWQKYGLGTMIEQFENGRRSLHFALNDHAVTAVKQMDEAAIIGRVKSVGWSNWIALAALFVSIAALLKPGS